MWAYSVFTGGLTRNWTTDLHRFVYPRSKVLRTDRTKRELRIIIKARKIDYLVACWGERIHPIKTNNKWQARCRKPADFMEWTTIKTLQSNRRRHLALTRGMSPLWLVSSKLSFRMLTSQSYDKVKILNLYCKRGGRRVVTDVMMQ